MIDYEELLREFMGQVEHRVGEYLVKDIIVFDVDVTDEERNKLLEIWREI